MVIFHAHLARHAECVAQLCLAASELSCTTALMILRHEQSPLMTRRGLTLHSWQDFGQMCSMGFSP